MVPGATVGAIVTVGCGQQRFPVVQTKLTPQRLLTHGPDGVVPSRQVATELENEKLKCHL